MIAPSPGEAAGGPPPPPQEPPQSRPQPPTAAQRRARARARGAQALLVIVVLFALSGGIRLAEFIASGPDAMARAWDDAVAAIIPPSTAPTPGVVEIVIGDPPGGPDPSTADIETATTPDADDPAGLAQQVLQAIGREAEAGGDDAVGAELPDFAGAAAPRAGAGVARLLEALQRREAELDAYEARLIVREQSIEAAARRVEERIEELERLTGEFTALISTVDQAAERDVEHLIGMYTRMRPADAGPVFNAMEPSFAAGFLARMRPDRASAILAQMTPEAAYAVSVELASRNVQTLQPTDE